MKLADAAAVRTYLPPGLVAPPLTALPADASNGKNKAAATAPMRENLALFGRCNSALMRVNRERTLVRVVALRVSTRLVLSLPTLTLGRFFGRENSSRRKFLGCPHTCQHACSGVLMRANKQLRGDLSTIGYRPNRVALPEKLNPLQLNLLKLLTSFVEFPTGASELRFPTLS